MRQHFSLDKKLGSFGEINCFSFYPTKNVGAFGDGGAIVTNNSKLAQVCREIRDYGQTRKYFHTRYGLNSRLDELHAAILQVKLKYLDKNNIHRRALAKKYHDLLSQLSNVNLVGSQPLLKRNVNFFLLSTKKHNKLHNVIAK